MSVRPDDRKPGDPAIADPGPAPVVLRRLSIGYGERTVVHAVDLTVHHGEVVAVVGANGSGKSTLVRGILGLASVHAGEVRLFGADLPGRAQRQRIGYVPQQLTVGGGIPSTVQEVVASARLAQRPWYSRPTHADRAAVEEAIAAVDLGDRRRATLSHLSGGQQRRALIARALAGQPEVLVMDEPLAGVDHDSRQSLLRTLARLVDRGLTMIIVTHETASLASILTRVVQVHQGRLVADRPAPGLVTG